jgi:hypothetical protein
MGGPLPVYANFLIPFRLSSISGLWIVKHSGYSNITILTNILRITTTIIFADKRLKPTT